MRKKTLAILVCLIVALLAAACGGQEIAPTEPTPFPEEEFTVTEPGGAELAIPAYALSQEAEVTVEDIGEGTPFAAGSPFSPASAEYNVDLGDADQVGQITMTVPLNGGAKEAAAVPSQVYLAWTEPIGGVPSVVGAIAAESHVTFPLVGAGKYQVFALPSHEALMQMFSITEPLDVPTYPQMTPAWCSPTAMTDLAQFHAGSWPIGGYGSVWGESSNWYLAGKAGQPFDTGYFFHWLLGAGGYAVPEDVKQSFSNGNAEVVIWNWKATPIIIEWGTEPFGFTVHFDYAYAEALFDAFQAYVESFVWGANEARRPVAWGSSLAGHSRVITGSDGTSLFANNPSSGALNQVVSWSDYHQQVLDSLTAEKIEVIDTVVFHANPRPSAQRRGVLWLLPHDDAGFPGSVALLQGSTGQPATNWHWDGSMGHTEGYFYEDLTGNLPLDPVFDSQFEATHYNDEVQFGFAVRSISDGTYDFRVSTALWNDEFSVLETVGVTNVTVGPGQRVDLFPAGTFRLYELPPGLYTLYFHLTQNGIFQDAKYVQFRVAESSLLVIHPQGVLLENAFCRKGPDPLFDAVAVIKARTEVNLVGVNLERTWGKFEVQVDDTPFECWIFLDAVEVTGVEDAPVLPYSPLPEPGGPACTSDLEQEECMAAGGVYVYGMARSYCQCPQ